jgi:hypothetical protein
MSRLFKQGIACLVLLVSGQALATEAADPGFSLIPAPLISLSGEEAFLPGERVVVDLGPAMNCWSPGQVRQAAAFAWLWPARRPCWRNSKQPD